MTGLVRRAGAECVGTAFLLAAVVGSGIMGERLSGGNVGIALLANSLATALALTALILAFSALSGAHFNPAVTLALASTRAFRWSDAPAYVLGQSVGAVAGVVTAHAMFGQALLSPSAHAREGVGQIVGELVATFGLVFTILACARHRSTATTAAAVATYVGAAYWFTSSTSFANPAVTLARAFTNSFAGIRPEDVAPFVAAQLVGAGAAIVAFRSLSATETPETPASSR